MEIAEGIWVVDNFLTPEECEEWIAFAEQIGFEDKKIVSGIRTSTKIDNQEKASSLWQRAKEHIPNVLNDLVAVGLNERFRFYRYDVGQKFEWHVDGEVILSNGQKSLLTFLIYLNEDYGGGETIFKNDGLTTVKSKTGSLLVFKHEIFHQGSEIKSGRKYVLRSDVMFSV